MVGAVAATWAVLREKWRSQGRRFVLTQLVVDMRALALMRIGLAACLIGNIAMRWGDVDRLYADDGVIARVGEPWSRTLFPLYDVFGASAQVRGWMLITALLAGLLALGFRTRMVTLACWWLLGSLNVRNNAVLQDGDYILQQLLLIGVFLPYGVRWSWDARRDPAAASLRRCSGPACALLISQMMLVYMMAGVIKMRFPHWWLGQGVAYGLQADHFATPLGVWLRSSGIPLQPFGVFTLLLEVFGPLVWLVARPGGRLRSAVMVGFFALHSGIALTINVGLFSFVCLAWWLFALPSHWLDELENFFTSLRGRQTVGTREPVLAKQIASARQVVSAAPRHKLLRAASNVLLLYLLSATFVYDISRTKSAPRRRLTSVLLLPAEKLGMKLHWAVFSGPRRQTGWYLVAGSDTVGRRFDLITGKPLDKARPQNVLKSFPNQRWRKLWVNFRKGYAPGLLRNYLKMLCRENRLAREVELIYMKREVRLDGTIPAAAAQRIGYRRCVRQATTPPPGAH